MNEVEYLDLEHLVRMIRRLGVGPVRDLGLLDAAVARPQTSLYGVEAYPSLHEKAAALLHSLARNHPLTDGNKRLAWLASNVFLRINGHPSVLSEDEAFQLTMAVADGTLDVPDIAERLARG